MRAFFGWTFTIMGTLVLGVGILGALAGGRSWRAASNNEDDLKQWGGQLAVTRTTMQPMSAEGQHVQNVFEHSNSTLQNVNQANKLASQIMLGLGVGMIFGGWGCRAIGRAICPT